MLTYFAIVHKDTNSAFGISFPDLPGCFSASDSENDVYANAQEALSLYMQEAGSVAPPRTIDQLRGDRAILAELAAGAYLIAIPVVYSSGKERYNIMLERAQVESIDIIAKRIGVSRSEFISRAIEQRMKSEIGAINISRHVGLSGGGNAAAMTATVTNERKSSRDAKSAVTSKLTQKAPIEKASARVASKAPVKKK